MKSSTSTTDLTHLSEAELRREIESKRLAAAKMRLGLDDGSEKNSGAYRALRRDIARLSTARTRHRHSA